MAGTNDVAIKVEHISKTFHAESSSKTIKEAIVNIGHKMSGKKQYHNKKGDYTALKDINFTVNKGDFFGIVGRNGSGKSTLLKILAGVYTPTKGVVTINGKLTPFIELGVGFNPELSGRDNVYLNAALLGFSRKQTDAMYNDIVDFAELHDFMDTKLKNYSSGMQVRLAFSVAIRAESDILLIDEVLAVGDAAFQRKCLNYFAKLKDNKRTVIFITHDMGSVRKYCNKAILLDKGLIKIEKNTEDAIIGYQRLFLDIESSGPDGEGENISELPIGMSPSSKIDKSFIRICDTWVENRYGKKSTYLDDDDKYLIVKLKIEAQNTLEGFVPGVVIRNLEGEFITASNSEWAEIPPAIKVLKKGDNITASFKIPNIYEKGDYSVSVNVVSKDLETFYDWRNKATVLQINRKFNTGAKAFPNYEVGYEK